MRNKGITFHTRKLLSYSPLTQEHWRLIIFGKNIHIFQSPLFILVTESSIFQFRISTFSNNFFYILSNCAIVLDGTSFTKEKCTTFDIAQVLKIKILPSIVSCCILHSFNNFSIFTFLVVPIIFYHMKKYIASILIALVFRFTHSISQSAIWSPFRTPILPISHLDLFGMNLGKNVTGFSLLRGKLVSSA